MSVLEIFAVSFCVAFVVTNSRVKTLLAAVTKRIR